MAFNFLQNVDWGNAAHWSLIVPITGDEVAIPETLGAAVTGTPDQTGVDLAKFRIHAGYEEDIFTSGSPIKIAATLLEHFGAGNLYYACAADTASAFKTDEVLIQAANNEVVTELDSVSADPGDFNLVTANRGIVRIKTNFAWDASGAVQIGHVDDVANDVKMEIAQGSDVLPNLHQCGGTLVCNRAITTATCAGRMTQDIAAVGVLFIGPGGHVTYNHTSGTSIVVCTGGTLNLLGNSVEKSFTDIFAMPNSIVIYDKNLLTVTNKRAGFDFRDFRTERA